jgi:heterodisulfide reductase subunit C
MEYSPREIIAALRAGMLDRVLKSNTVWLCTSCYYCTVRCPQKIKFTDIMYELKRLGTEYGLFPKDAKAPVMAKLFIDLVDNFGRNQETNLMVRYYMKTGLADAFKNAGRGFRLYSKGRLSNRTTRIKGIDQLRKIREVLASYEEKEKSAEVR